MKLKPLLEGKPVDVSKLDYEGLKSLLIEYVIHGAAQQFDEDLNDTDPESLMDIEEALDFIANQTYEMAKQLYHDMGRITRDDATKPFKKLYPKLYNEIAKKH